MAKHEDKKRKSIMAITGLAVGIVALLLSAVPIINNFAFVLGILALIFSVIALVGVKRKKVSGKRLGVASLIISVLSLVIVLASQAMYGAALDSASKALNDSADKASGAKTDDLLKSDVDVKLGAFTATTDQYGLTTSSLPITITNKLADKKSYSVQVEAVDASGKRITDDTVYVNDLGAKQSQDQEAFKYVDPAQLDTVKTAKFNVVKVTEF